MLPSEIGQMSKKRELVVIVDDTGERLKRFDVTDWSDSKVERRMCTLLDRYDTTRVTVYDTQYNTLPDARRVR